MLLGKLGASLLRNLLGGKGVIRAGYGDKKGKGIVELVMDPNWIFKTAS